MALKKLKILPPTICSFSVFLSWLGRSLPLALTPYFIFKNEDFEGKKGEKKFAFTLRSLCVPERKVDIHLTFPNVNFFKSRHLLVIPKWRVFSKLVVDLSFPNDKFLGPIFSQISA